MDRRQAPLGDKKTWHIDQINEAPTAGDQLMRAFNYARAVLVQLEGERRRDADDFRRDLAYKIVDFTNGTRRGVPRREFPRLPGGSKDRPARQITGRRAAR